MRRIFFAFILVLPFFTNAQVITTVAGGGISGLGDGGPATAASIGFFGALCFDSSGNCYIADANNHRIRKVGADGIIATIAGTGIPGYNGDGIAATTANLDYPNGICIDIHDNLLIADTNSRIRIVNLQTGIINTFAGTGITGFSGDSGLATAAKIRSGPIAADHFGNIYIGDGANFRIRKVDATGIITTICGTGVEGSSGNGGPATAAILNYQLSMCTDAVGNLYFNDNNTNTIRKIDFSTGFVSLVVGDGVGGPYNGDGIPATSANINPVGVIVDSESEIFVADYGAARIRKISTSSLIYTVAGNGTNGFSGDNDLATVAEINHPEGVALDHCNNLYIADYANKRVRKVAFNPECRPEAIESVQKNKVICIYPNPTYNTIIITAPVLINNISITNMLGQQVYTHSYSTQKAEIDVSYLPLGVYTVRVNDTYVQKLVKE